MDEKKMNAADKLHDFVSQRFMEWAIAHGLPAAAGEIAKRVSMYASAEIMQGLSRTLPQAEYEKLQQMERDFPMSLHKLAASGLAVLDSVLEEGVPDAATGKAVVDAAVEAIQTSFAEREAKVGNIQ